ncbi:UBA domain-containing protein [Fusibacter ferrireducens]|uniref:DUF4342 domain-containing protein n=1 Tax=Fusibacter ferrireducens TaxID=2785058 RepID=A0ABR9ZZL1_9FIRM|nr:hypothetical protein [Fusibacter ferrireducens]MBF4695340.1 hypothetical protein [Fusibacter ferrireducens]
MSDNLDQIDQIIKRTNCSYKEASDALQNSNGDVVEAIILIETQNTESEASENSDSETIHSESNCTDGADVKLEWKSEAFKAQIKFLWSAIKKIFKKMLKMKIAWQKNSKTYVELPLIIVILVAWFTLPFSIIVLALPFFLGFNVILKTNGKKDKNINKIIQSQFDKSN